MPSSAEAEKYRKLKRTIIAGVLISAIIIGWHLYEYLVHQKIAENETEIEHEIHELTKRLFTIEQKNQQQYLIKINYQRKTKTHERIDEAPEPLLVLNEDLLMNDKSSTIYYMRRLFDNYDLDTQNVEYVTEEEKQEEYDFLAAILKTPIMKKTMEFLQHKGYASTDPKLQMKLLYDLWFQQYSRGRGIVGSSGFEHVFLAEIKESKILGLHNWFYFYEQEKLGKLDYKGYIEKIDLGNHQHLVAVRFSFNNIQKQYNTLFVGTSPELEMSIYTICFILNMNLPCSIQFGEKKFLISTYSWDWYGKKVISSAFPAIENSMPNSVNFNKTRPFKKLRRTN